MSGSRRPRGVLVLGPAWHSCGSYEVFKRQMRCLRDLGFATCFLGVGVTADMHSRHPYWGYWYRMTPDLGADFRGHVGASRLPFRHRDFWTDLPRRALRSVAYWRTFPTRLMSVPSSVSTFLADHRVDTVICHHYFNLPLALKIARRVPGARIVLETQDIQSHHYLDREIVHPLRRTPDGLAALLHDEMEIAAVADVLVHYNEDETATFRRHLPHKRHETVFPAFDRHYERCEPTGEVFDYLIVASANEPNFRSVKWFLDEVWTPDLDRRYRLQIVGNIDHEFSRRNDPTFARHRRSFVGRVEHVAPYYRNARAVIAPVIEGHGIAIKTLEALSYGKVIVATPLAYRGFDRHVPEALRAEGTADPQALRARIATLDASPPAQDPRNIALFERLFTVEAQRAAYRDLLGEGS